MVGAITVQVFTRYALGRPIAWVEEIGDLRLHLDVLRRRQPRPEAGPAHPHRDLRRAPAAARRPASCASWSGLWCSLTLWHLLVVQVCKVMGVEGRSSTISLPVELPRSWFYSLPLTLSCAVDAPHCAYLLLSEIAVIAGQRREHGGNLGLRPSREP